MTHLLMQLNQNLKDSDGKPYCSVSQKMKISLFYNPLVTKACFFLVFISIVSFYPYRASANVLLAIKSFMGNESLAAEDDYTDEIVLNSQNLPLLESVAPDMKNIKDEPSVVIGNDTISTEGSFFGKGIETIYDGNIVVYEVKEGDTLSEIAESFNVSTNTIRWENNISGQTIKIGQKLNILPVTGVKHIVKKGDTISAIALKYDGDSDEISIYNGLTDNNSLKIGDIIFVPNGIIKNISSKSSSSSSKSSSSSISGYYIRPASGPITSPYGPRWGSFHYGIDIGNKRGTPVVAAASGKVIKVISGCKEGVTSCGGRYGNYITIEHSNGQRTIYAHLQNINVSVGQKVSQGSKIGTIGNTGRSTGPHLHFQIEKSNGSTIKPSF